MPQGTPVPVDIQHAADETARWRTFMQSISGGDPGNIINGYYIPIDDVDAILAKAGALGYTVSALRVYFALRDTGGGAGQNIHLYAVAVDQATGDDIYITPSGDSLIYDSTMPCPNMCGTANPLNGGA